MLRNIVEKIYWSIECGTSSQRTARTAAANPEWFESGKDVHSSVNSYIIKGDRSLVFDTLGPASDQKIIDDLEHVLDGQDLDYIVPSHFEPPHAANTLKIQDHFPEAEIVTSVDASHGEMHDLYGTEDSLKVKAGDTFDLGQGYEVEFHRTIFTDMGMTIGLFEKKTKTLFTVDWFGYYHMDGQCDKFADEFPHPLTLDQLIRFHSGALYWFKYADEEKTNELIDEVIERYSPSIIVPAHGNVVRENATEHIQEMKDVIDSISSQGLREWGSSEGGDEQ